LHARRRTFAARVGAAAGDNFRGWIKSFRKPPPSGWSKLFTHHNMPVKSGDNAFLKTIFAVGTAVAKEAGANAYLAGKHY
jgi:hypothetical protein